MSSSMSCRTNALVRFRFLAMFLATPRTLFARMQSRPRPARLAVIIPGNHLRLRRPLRQEINPRANPPPAVQMHGRSAPHEKRRAGPLREILLEPIEGLELILGRSEFIQLAVNAASPGTGWKRPGILSQVEQRSSDASLYQLLRVHVDEPRMENMSGPQRSIHEQFFARPTHLVRITEIFQEFIQPFIPVFGTRQVPPDGLVIRHFAKRVVEHGHGLFLFQSSRSQKEADKFKKIQLIVEFLEKLFVLLFVGEARIARLDPSADVAVGIAIVEPLVEFKKPFCSFLGGVPPIGARRGQSGKSPAGVENRLDRADYV